MLILIIIPFIAVLIYIGSRLKKLDSFIAERGFISAEDNSAPSAIVFGDTPVAKQVADELKKRGIAAYALSEPYVLERGENYKYLFALSDDDADNILMCKIARKIYGIENMVSLCADSSNEDMYRHEKIPCVLLGSSTDKLLGSVLCPQEMQP